MYWNLRLRYLRRVLIAVVMITSVTFIVWKENLLFFPSRPSKVLVKPTAIAVSKLSDSSRRQQVSKPMAPQKHPKEKKSKDATPNKTSPGKHAVKQGQNKNAKAMEIQYYKPRNVTRDHCDYAFLMDGSSICEDRAPFLLIMIPSVADNTGTRQLIRETWAQYAINKTLPQPYKSRVIKLVFILGKWINSHVRDVIKKEGQQFGDIVVGDFKDSYRNLTRKILMGLKWITMFCSEVDYILKTDVDIYINIPVLVDFLTKNPANLTGSVYGHLYPGGRVHRSGRWAVTKDEFPFSQYPPYMSGNSYIISGALPPRFLYTSQHMPYLPIEDAFITGILPRINGVSQINHHGFTDWKKSSPNPCAFIQENKISGNKVNRTLMKRIWSAHENFQQLCKKNNTR